MVLVTKKKRKPSVHDRRRKGDHHARDGHYHKAYWPYLPLALIVGLGMLVNTFWGTIQQAVLSYATDMSISSLLQETNEERVSTGLGNLTLNAKLNQAAQAKAEDMAARDYWSHNTPEGSPPWIFFTNAGYSYQTAGENLAYGFDTSTNAVVGWMNSPGHKANILNNSYTEVGFGIANASNYQGTGPETIVVAMYASPQVASASSGGSQPAQSAAKPTPAPTPAPAAETPAQETPAPTPTATNEEANTTPVVQKPDQKQPTTVTTQDISRVQLLAGGSASWSIFAVTAIAAVSLFVFFLRHGMLWHRVLVKSEIFVHKHLFLDIILISLATISIILSRSDGLIR
jgi:hypothetical protein